MTIYSYLEEIFRKNKLLQSDQFRFCRVTGINGMEDAVGSMNKVASFFCVDNVSDGTTFQNSGSWYNRKITTVFIVKKYKTGYITDYEEKLALCRKIYNQLLTRIIKDRELLAENGMFVNLSRITFREFDQNLLDSSCGAYFLIEYDTPEDLSYNTEEWNEL